MTTFEKYIDITKKRKEYELNIEVIEKLKEKILDDYDLTSIEDIKEAIDEVQRQQNSILKDLGVNSLEEILEKEKEATSNIEFKSMRKNLYSSMKDSFIKYEEEKKIRESRKVHKQELEEARMDARDIIIKTKKAIRKLENRIEKQDAEETKFLVKELEEYLNCEDVSEIRSRIDKLKAKDAFLAEKFYEKFNGNQTEINEEDIIEYEDEIIEVDEEIGNDDITEVLTSNMKEKPTVEVLDTEAVRKEVFKDAKIVYDGKYTLYFNNEMYTYEADLDKHELQRNIYEENPYDYNIQNMLRTFDEKNNTKLYDRYINNKLPVHYDYVKSKKNGTKNSILKKLHIITDRQKELKDYYKTTITDNKKSNFKAIATSIALATMTLLGCIGVFKSRNKEPQINPVAITTEEYAGNSDALMETTELNTIEETTTESFITEDKNEVDNYEKEEVKEEKDVVEDIVETRETKVGDIIQFTDDVDLYYASTDENPRGNTSYIEEKNFKVGLISVVHNGEVVGYTDNSDITLEELEEECKKKYGDDIEVAINVASLDNSEEVVNQYLGWIDNEQYQEYGKVLVK